MKKIIYPAILMLILSLSTNAQVFELSLNGYTPFVVGDISSTDATNSNSGYVTQASGTNFQFMYNAKNNLGVGFRVYYNQYYRDIDTYKEDIMASLNVNDSNFLMQSVYIYNSFGFQIGINGKFHILPHFFIGGNIFTSPAEQIIYFDNNTTYTRKKPITAFVGINYTPGIKFQWNLVDGHLGLNIYAEYDGVILEDWDEEVVTYSNNSFIG